MPWWVLPFHLVLAIGCSSECQLIDGLRDRSGSGARNCGHVALGADRSAVDSCVLLAFENRAPFFAMYDGQGDDSQVAFGIAADAKGTVTFLYWDSDPSGGSNADAVVHG